MTTLNVSEAQQTIANFSPAAGRVADQLVAEIVRLRQLNAQGELELQRLKEDQAALPQPSSGNWGVRDQSIRKQTREALGRYLWHLFHVDLPTEEGAMADIWDLAVDEVRQMLGVRTIDRIDNSHVWISKEDYAALKRDLAQQQDIMAAAEKRQQGFGLAAQANYEAHAMELHGALGYETNDLPHQGHEHWREWWETLLKGVARIVQENRDALQSLTELKKADSPYDLATASIELDRHSKALDAAHGMLLEFQEGFLSERRKRLKGRRNVRTAMADVTFYRESAEACQRQVDFIDMILRGLKPALAESMAQWASPTAERARKLMEKLAATIDTAERETNWRMELEQQIEAMRANRANRGMTESAPSCALDPPCEASHLPGYDCGHRAQTPDLPECGDLNCQHAPDGGNHPMAKEAW